MTEDDLSFLPQRVTRVGVGGKRSFDPTDNRRLVEACLRPGASLSGLALKAGVNANQLHKWVRAREQLQSLSSHDGPVAASAFIPVIAIDEPTTPMASKPTSHRATRAESSCVSPRSIRLARLSDRPATAADLKEGFVEVQETAEEPVVAITARVIEEVIVGKESSNRTETVNDTVRGTDVEVKRVAGQEGAVRPDVSVKKL